MYYSDLLNSSVTRQNINNNLKLSRHRSTQPTHNILNFLHSTPALFVFRPLKEKRFNIMTRSIQRNAIGRKRATISCYIAGVRDAICVKEFYYLWVVAGYNAGTLLLEERAVYHARKSTHPFFG